MLNFFVIEILIDLIVKHLITIVESNLVLRQPESLDFGPESSECLVL